MPRKSAAPMSISLYRQLHLFSEGERMSEIIQLPLEKLSITSTNARKDHVADKAMMASLKSQGLLYPLLVKGIPDTANYDVIDGARRLTCILQGLEEGIFSIHRFETIPCILSNGDARSTGLEQSLHANLHMAMHPLDECEAILKLAEDEDDKAAIGLRFGQDEKWVDQRVKLASLADEVKTIFRAGEISLTAAMAFTLGSPEQQKRFLKQHRKHGFNTQMIAPAMTEKAIKASYINFDLADYPADKIQRDLFSEEVFLLDRKKVDELQDIWAQGEIERLKQLGYDEVRILEPDDWQTLQAHVAVGGRISAEARTRLKCFLQRDHHGYIKVYEGYASRKAVEKAKVKKDKHAADSVDSDAEVKPLLCTELSPAQQEIVNALAASAVYSKIEEGDELLAQFMVVDQQFGAGVWTDGGRAHVHNGTISRWTRLNKDYPAEQLIIGAEIEAIGQLEPQKLDYAAWRDLKPSTRQALFLKACASLVRAPYGQQKLKPSLLELKGTDWLVPGEDFFKRFRTDQLIDYRRRSGDKEAGKTPKKKGDHVADCVVLADSSWAFTFGLVEKKPARGKKPKDVLPSA